ncbi:MAG: hypothetical protein H8D87_12140 [Deltaproteobacteria bacterium]|uniref:hypothetical protein n=1 Tax=Desulfobacula sp. TaxID=2593537 RepID=UPI0019C1565F|nr:hypothetical protein [Candidatus Desulfobacula maris]MBL6993094.1 hypothetical protein [Desulfobacula sp.]
MAEAKLFLYARKIDDISKQLEKAIKLFVPETNIEIRLSIDSLSDSLSHSANHNTIAILLAAGKKDLDDLLTIYDLLVTIHCILILPDDDMETIAKGHKLYPRFISYTNSDFKDTGAVLEKILKTIK